MQKIYVFDLGGVLMQHNRPGCQERLTELLGAEGLTHVLGQLDNGEGAEGSLMERYELGLCSTDEFLSALMTCAKPGTTRAELIEAWNLIHAGIPEYYLTVLRMLKAQGHRLFMLSNNNELRWQDVADKYDLSMFEKVFLSHELHCIKPDRHFYEVVDEYANHAPIIFIDDLEANRLEAEKLGWQTYESVEQLLRSTLRNVVFDLGGVLVDLFPVRSIHAMAALLAPQPKDDAEDKAPISLMDLLGGGESELVRRYQTGQVSTDDFVAAILSVCRPGTTREQVLDAWYAMLGTIPEPRLDMIRRLNEAGYHVYILSNINEAHVAWVADNYPTLPALCDKVFYSNEIQIAKPDLAAYDHVIAHAPLVPHETLYIDDLEQNIAAGQTAGFLSLQALGDAWLPIAQMLL